MEENATVSDPLIFIITGTIRKANSTEMIPFNALLSAPDDDSAVRGCLNALAQEGYEEANLDQIGNLFGRPEDEKFEDAYDAALNGDVALLIFEGGSSLKE
jgi:hypothetical protein